MESSLITSSSSFSSNPPQIKRHVFLSFRGEDTRFNFTSHLEKALRDEQIKTYTDDQLNIGDEISPTLHKAIEESQISVIVFSKGYASSRWCLEELVKILECREIKEQMVIPVFYGVDPSDVRNQTGCYADAFAKHQQRFTQSLDEVQRWKDSLKEAAEISGCNSLDILNHEELLNRVVEDIVSHDNMLRFKMGKTGWVKGVFLGCGSFGSVYEGINGDGFSFAVKEVSLHDDSSQGERRISNLKQEIALLSRFKHENIVRYLGTDKDESKLCIFLELAAQGSLRNLYIKNQLTDTEVSAHTREILHGLKYLHDQKVVHRDIKCANILVDARGRAKLADFGLAKFTKLNDVKSFQGTAFWMAPEVVNNNNQGYGIQADIWSLGCTVLEMLTRQIPYSPLEWQQALFQIGKGVLPPIPDHLSKDAREFILKCLQTNPSDRPTAAQLLDHPFLNRPLPTFSGSPSPRLGKRKLKANCVGTSKLKRQ